jgi:YesN/AraC family two-component response regulator
MRLATLDGSLPSVLVVDDEPLVRSFLSTALEPIARVDEAADADRALDLLRERAGATALVLVDQVLPRRSGLEVLQITKSTWPWIPVALLTGFGSEDLAVQALRAGASDYLRKPIGVAALLETVARLVASRGEPAPPAAGGGTENRARPVHPNIRRALAFMSEHFAEPISLANVAREAGLSRFHFCRLFHHEIGVPFHEHLHDLRVHRAKTLLADRYLRVSEVAYAVGFNDLSHFDRTFRKMVGRSPSEYRASLHCA